MIPKTVYGNEVAYWNDKNDLCNGMYGKILGSVWENDVSDFWSEEGSFSASYYNETDEHDKSFTRVVKNNFDDIEKAKRWIEHSLCLGKVCQNLTGKWFSIGHGDPVFTLQIHECIDEKISEWDTFFWSDHYDISEWINTNDMAAYVWNALIYGDKDRLDWDSKNEYPRSLNTDNEEIMDEFEEFTDCVNGFLREAIEWRKEMAPSIVANIKEKWDEDVVIDKPWKDDIDVEFLEKGDDIEFSYDPSKIDLGREQLRDYIREAIFALDDGSDIVRIREVHDLPNHYKVQAYVLCR